MFLVGTGSGAVLAIISMLLINAENAEQYPLGGFIPALWILADWGSFSQIEVAGILILGGMSGYYLLLTFWKERPEILHNNFQPQNYEQHDSASGINAEQQTVTVSGKSLAEFL